MRRVALGEADGVLGASNLRAEQIAPPIASRFVLVNQPDSRTHKWRALLGDAMQRITQAMTFWIMSAIAMAGCPTSAFAVLAVVQPLYCRSAPRARAGALAGDVVAPHRSSVGSLRRGARGEAHVADAQR